MKTETLILLCSGAIFGFVIGYYIYKRYRNSFSNSARLKTGTSGSDTSYASELLEKLNNEWRHITEITDQKLLEHFEGDQVLLSSHPTDNDEDRKSGASFFNGPADTRYWPYYHYTFPYQYTEGGAWPPNMYSRLYNWQPGFATSGWSYWMRPGMSYARWPRNRWVKNNGSFYFINNGKDRTKDFF